MDLKQHFKLTDENNTTLTEENCPKGSRFVSAKNRLYEIVAWEQTGTGSPRVYLKQSNEGSADFEEGSTEVHRDVVSTIDVMRVPSEPIVAEVMDDLGMGDDLDADLEENVGTDVPDDDAVEAEPAAEAPALIEEEFITEQIDIPAAEEATAEPAAADDDDMEETAADTPAVDPEPEPAEVVDEFAPIEPVPAASDDADAIDAEPAPAAEVPQSSATPLKTSWDGKQGIPSGVIMARAAQGLTVAEIAQECLDKALYTEKLKSLSNVMRTVRKLRTQGYGVMFMGDQDDPNVCRVHLTRDGVTPWVPEFIPDSPDPAGILAAQIRQRMGIHDIKDLPPQLAAALSGITPNELGLTPNQYQGIVLVSLGMCLMLGGKV